MSNVSTTPFELLFSAITILRTENEIRKAPNANITVRIATTDARSVNTISAPSTQSEIPCTRSHSNASGVMTRTTPFKKPRE